MEFYAFRQGFGSEGHGSPVLLAASSIGLEDCEEKAIRQLQAEFGTLWTAKLQHTWVGSLNFIARSSKWTRRELQDVIDERLASGEEIPS
jgi:hypothetical protein